MPEGHDLIRKNLAPRIGPVTEREMPSFAAIRSRIRDAPKMADLLTGMDAPLSVDEMARAIHAGIYKLITTEAGEVVGFVPVCTLWP